jgi:hypothetical protein
MEPIMKNWLLDMIVKHQMTKKHFEAFANAYGFQLRFLNPNDVEQFWLGIRIFEDVCKQFNPNFDVTTFEDWIRDIAEKRRDLNGKKIKGAK